VASAEKYILLVEFRAKEPYICIGENRAFSRLFKDFFLFIYKKGKIRQKNGSVTGKSEKLEKP